MRTLTRLGLSIYTRAATRSLSVAAASSRSTLQDTLVKMRGLVLVAIVVLLAQVYAEDTLAKNQGRQLGGFHGQVSRPGTGHIVGGRPGGIHGGRPGGIHGGRPGGIHGGRPGGIHGGHFPGMKMLTCLTAGLVMIVGSLAQQDADGDNLPSEQPRSYLQSVFNSAQGLQVASHIGGRPINGIKPNSRERPIYGVRPHSGERPSYGVLGASDSCRYWCRTPENTFYCCDSSTVRTSTFRPARVGCCPPVRPDCPRTYYPQAPVTCVHDSSCSNTSDKCCYDRCLEQHVCKPSQPCSG
nr:uncharacterized protein LOC123745142 [Procambarus clarkii]